MGENTVGKGEFARYEQFIISHTVFKRLLMQTHKNLGLFGKGLSSLQAIYPFPTLFSRLVDYYSHVKIRNCSGKG